MYIYIYIYIVRLEYITEWVEVIDIPYNKFEWHIKREFTVNSDNKRGWGYGIMVFYWRGGNS